MPSVKALGRGHCTQKSSEASFDDVATGTLQGVMTLGFTGLGIQGLGVWGLGLTNSEPRSAKHF